jgi:hypothetical protein
MRTALRVMKYIENNDFITDLLDKSDVQEAISEIEEAMKNNSCEGCEFEDIAKYRLPCQVCNRMFFSKYKPKEKE